MAKPRLELHALFKTFADNVYYQPPSSIHMVYPAIVYSLNNSQKIHANNNPYLKNNQYIVTVIDRNPDSSLAEKVENLRMCSLNRTFTSDNLNHFVYTLYY